MKKTKHLWISLIGIVCIAIIVVSLARKNKPGEIETILESAPNPINLGEYQRTSGPKELIFPSDHGPHPDYLTEWWYFTGNLDTENGRHFGYQLTFFRRALSPFENSRQRSSTWAANQVYMAHFALTDVKESRFHATERLQRGAAGLAGATANPFQVWLDDWKVEQTGAGTYSLRASGEGLSIDLNLKDVKGLILQGDQGYSQKGADPGNGSYYVSLPRLETEGVIQVDARTYAVNGSSWMDHEWSTSALTEDQVGWDWFSLQLDDGSDLMLFQIRRTDGSIDPFSSGAIIAADGGVERLSKEDFQIQRSGTWKSPHNKSVYPSGWQVEIPRNNLSLTIKPYVDDQELNLAYTYWEGAVRVQGNWQGKPITGNGYVELTGYAGSMAGEF